MSEERCEGDSMCSNPLLQVFGGLVETISQLLLNSPPLVALSVTHHPWSLCQSLTTLGHSVSHSPPLVALSVTQIPANLEDTTELSLKVTMNVFLISDR